MKMKLRRKKGTVLLQTLVMAVILSMIAVMMMKWVLARYMMAARNYRSVATTTRVGGYTQAVFSSWNFNTGPVLPPVPDGKAITYTPTPGVTVRPGVTTTRIQMDSEEDP